MATQKGVWNLQQGRDKQLQSLWDYEGTLSGSLYLWGPGYNGAIGNNKADGHNPAPSVMINSPTQVPGTWANAIFAGNGGDMNGGIKTDGTVWAWGRNTYGQLGQNNVTSYSSPVQVGSDTTWRKRSDTPGSNGVSGHASIIQAGSSCFAFKTDGTLWGWGANGRGFLAQPGDDYTGSGGGPGPHHSSPVQIPGTTWKLIAANASSTAFGIKTDGTLWSWGYNSGGKLGLNQPGAYPALSISSPTQIPGTTWKTIVVNGGSNGVLATKTDGTLWAWGNNLRGQFGNNTSGPGAQYSSPVQITGTTWDRPLNAGGDVSVVLKTDGTLWGMGKNEVGELGINNANQISSPTQIPGTTWKDGAGKQGRTYATKTDGTLWAWGTNYYGSLGISESSYVLYSSPVQVPGTWISVHTWDEGGGGIK